MHKITKLKSVDNPISPTAENHDQYRESLVSSIFKMGDDHLSPNVDYWIVGEIISPPRVGGFLVMDRWMRNGLIQRGRFFTTEIKKVENDQFETLNSIYKIEEISDEEIMEIVTLKI